MVSPSSREMGYRMVSMKDEGSDALEDEEFEDKAPIDVKSIIQGIFNRQTYTGSIMFNFGAFMLPALYGTLSKLWIADIDSNNVAITDVYNYIGVIVLTLNEGLPRSAWSVIGDKTNRSITSRISLTYTLILVQTILGAILTIFFIAATNKLAGAFVPEALRSASLNYIRISSVQALSGTLETAVASSTRALDHPDVPLLISSCKLVVNIILDLLFISRFHVGSFKATINTQAVVRMLCDLVSAVAGLLYFLHISVKMGKDKPKSKAWPGWFELKLLVQPGIYTFLESALRNAIYLWLVTGVVKIGVTYATAWGVADTVRWGLVMVPVQTLEASTLAFVGHSWGEWREQKGADVERPKASREDLTTIMRYSWVSCALAVATVTLSCLFLSLWGIKGYALYLSGSEEVATLTQKMWKSIGWFNIFYALNTPLAAIFLATVPRWYFLQALISNVLWLLPWAIAVSRIGLTEQNAWTYHAIIFGSTPVFTFLEVCCVLRVWTWRLSKGEISLPRLAVPA